MTKKKLTDGVFIDVENYLSLKFEMCTKLKRILTLELTPNCLSFAQKSVGRNAKQTRVRAWQLAWHARTPALARASILASSLVASCHTLVVLCVFLCGISIKRDCSQSNLGKPSNKICSSFTHTSILSIFRTSYLVLITFIEILTNFRSYFWLTLKRW